MLTNILYRSSITDEQTCFKMLEAKLLKNIELERKGFEFCTEATNKILKKGIKIVELPISHKLQSIKEGEKIRWIDGAIAI